MIIVMELLDNLFCSVSCPDDSAIGWGMTRDVYENVSKSSEESRIEAHKDATKTIFSFKQFKACGPKEFSREDGPTAMFQWFDSVEVTLRQSGCPENLRTLNVTGVFQSRALD
ncbi:hypothetical protein HanRHA438_Chr07g0296891 [Helianthus annuus]|nr:hypothetical protein HanRHA438_Chr07g0296891 [Helianthus annuus]